MRKFRVVTDNLDWVPIRKGEIITVECKFKGINFLTEVRDSEDNVLLEDCLLLMDKHPEWFQEIKEEETKGCSFTLSDMVDFGRYVQGLTKAPTISIDAHVLNKWSQRVRTVSKIEDSPKEEPKEFTREDLVKLAMFLGNETWWEPTNTLIRTANFHDTLADLAVTYFLVTIREHK